MKRVAVTPRAVKTSGTMAHGLSHVKCSAGILTHPVSSALGANPASHVTQVSLNE